MKMKYLNYLNTLIALVMVCLQAAPALSMAVENGVVDYRHIGSNLLPINVAASVATLVLVATGFYLYRRKKISNKPGVEERGLEESPDDVGAENAQ